MQSRRVEKDRPGAVPETSSKANGDVPLGLAATAKVTYCCWTLP